MAQLVTGLLKRVLSRKWQRNLVYFRDLAERIDNIETTADRAAQGLASLVVVPPHVPDTTKGLEQWEFRLRSQSGEDGVIHHLFEQIGVTNRTFVEFGIQSGRECNAAHLALSRGWRGLFLEGDHRLAAWANEYYERMLGTGSERVRVSCCFVTRENINSVLAAGGASGVIDLLSIDIDGNDYWIWDAIEVAEPRVVVIEYNAVFGPSRPVTIPYQPNFQRSILGGGMYYYGASLTALHKLARRKGYVLAGCGSNGINAFFVRRELYSNEMDTEEAFRPHYGLSRTLNLEQQWQLVASLPLIDV